MREIIAKNITSSDRKKKDVLICETIKKEGIIAILRKRSLYFIRDIIEVRNPQEREALLQERLNPVNSKCRHTHILKLHNTKEGRDVFLYKTIGDLYAVLENKIFFITLLHYTRMEFIHYSAKK